MSLREHYTDKLRPELHKAMGYKSIMAVPKLEKIVLNMGVGEAVNDKKVLDHAVNDLTLIAGQKPIITISKKSEAGFKIREGWPIGCKVTLRNKNMYNFLERFIAVVCPKIRDFRGFSVKSFDGRGNISIGIKEQIVFSEVRYDLVDKIRGLDITIATSAKSDQDALALLKALNLPFKDEFKKAKKDSKGGA